MASLVKQKSYYYLQFYSASRKPTKKRIPLGTRTKLTALKLQRKLEDEFALGEYDPWINKWEKEENSTISQESPIGEALEFFISLKTEKDWRKGTARNTSYVLRSFIRNLDQNISVSQLTINHFNDYLNQDGIKYETKISYKKTLKTFLIWLEENKLAKLNKKHLVIHNESYEQEENINYFTKDDIEKLINYIKIKVKRDLEKGYQKKSRNALWLVDFIHWQRLSGMRLSETLNLRIKDINTSSWEIRIGNEHFTTKSKRKQVLPIESVTPLKQIVTKKLDECTSKDERLFQHSCKRNTHRLFKKYLRLALPEKDYLNIHSLRHTCCIELLRAGVPIYTVQRWLRHADVKTTQHYADLLNMDISEQIGRAFNKY